jgi:hypothetical protein
VPRPVPTLQRGAQPDRLELGPRERAVALDAAVHVLRDAPFEVVVQVAVGLVAQPLPHGSALRRCRRVFAQIRLAGALERPLAVLGALRVFFSRAFHDA